MRKKQRGYITIAQRSGKTNYLKMAYALALSLKATQSEVSDLTVLVTPGTHIPKKYAAVFDEVIEIPWGDDAETFQWKIQNKWKVFHLTPYEETVLLDADMIFPTDVSHWWDLLYEKDIWFTNRPRTFRGEPVTPGIYRGEFVTNDLPMIYTAFAYFRQTQFAVDFFKMVKDVYHGWGHLRMNYKYRRSDDELLADMADEHSWMRWRWTHYFRDFPRYVSGDLACAIAAKIMGVEDQVTQDGSFPTFVHMKPGDQGVRLTKDSWRDMFSFTLRDDISLLVNNYRQQYPFHYVEKDWLSEDIMRKLERAANG